MGSLLRLAIVVLLAVVSSGGRAQTGDAVGELVQLRGDVALVRPDGTVPATVGQAVGAGDEIRTEAESRAKLQFLDGTVVTVGPESRLVVVAMHLDAAGGRDAAILSTVLGAVRAVVTPGGSFEIQTYTAVASVRSTDWLVEASPEVTSVLVLDGEVAVAGRVGGPGTDVLLGAGDGTDVPAGQPPAPPRPWGAARIQALVDRTALP